MPTARVVITPIRMANTKLRSNPATITAAMSAKTHGESHMPVVVTAPSGELLEKTLSNLQEVAARGGSPIILITDEAGEAAHHAASELLDGAREQVFTCPAIQ